MKRTISLVAAGAILALASVAGAGAAHGVGTNCTGTLSGGSYAAINVPSNATCTLNSALAVTGAVTVSAGAQLFADHVTIGGSLSAKAAKTVQVTSSSTHSILLAGTTGGGATDPIYIDSNTVTGQIKIAYSTGGTDGDLFVTNNSLSSNLSLHDNSVPLGSTLSVSGNSTPQRAIIVFRSTGKGDKFVDSNASHVLQCRDNTLPFTATGNAALHKSGQCS